MGSFVCLGFNHSEARPGDGRKKWLQLTRHWHLRFLSSSSFRLRCSNDTLLPLVHARPTFLVGPLNIPYTSFNRLSINFSLVKHKGEEYFCFGGPQLTQCANHQWVSHFCRNYPTTSFQTDKLRATPLAFY